MGVAWALAFAAGCVDVIGWLALDRLYTSHVTGNTASIGIELAKGRGGEAFTRSVPGMAFLAGAFGGAVIAERLCRRGERSAIAPGLGITAVLLCTFLIWASRTAHAGVVPLEPRWAFHLQAALLAAAMGVQTVTFRRVDGATVRTTFLTGMITQLAEELADRVLARRDPARDAGFARRLVVVGGVWPAFLAGAVAGAFGHARWGTAPLGIPITVLAAVAGLDLARPQGGPAGPVEGRRAQRRTARE
jgi:uncharacterized membrane protein YoaK (UPF0700 family)